jgi:hypothetical protein
MRLCALQLVAAGLFVGLASAQDGQNEARAIVEKAIKAHGGEAYLKKYAAATLKIKGHLEILGGFDLTQEMRFQLPDKFRQDSEFEIMGQQIRSSVIYNAGKAHLEVNGQKVDMGDKLVESLKDGTRLMVAGKLVPLRDKGYELSVVGEADVNGKPAVGVRVVKEGQRDVILYFDKKTSLIAKMEHRTVDPMSEQELTEERIITEYHKVDGVPEPKKILINRDSKKFLEAEVVEMKLHEKLDDGDFKLP